jgi:hypothetical protein
MAKFLLCGYIAQQWSLPCPQVFGAIYGESQPWPWPSMPWHCYHVVAGYCVHVDVSAWFFPYLTTNPVVIASMMPVGAAAAPHGYSAPVVSGTIIVFWVARESPTIVDSWLCRLRGDDTDSVTDGFMLMLHVWMTTMTQRILYGSAFFAPSRLCVLVAPPGLCSVNRPIPTTYISIAWVECSYVRLKTFMR